MADEPDASASSRAEEVPQGSLARGLRILELVAAHSAAASIGTLAKNSGLDKGTTSRIVTSLVSLGYLNRREDRSVTLTSRALVLAHGFEASFDLKRLARPTVSALSAQLAETVHLAVPDRGRVVYVDSVRPATETAFASIVGLTADMHVTATGRALLYAMPEKKRNDLVTEAQAHPLEPELAFDADEFARGLRSVSADGYVSIDRRDGIARVAAAVVDATGEPLAALGVFSARGDAPDVVDALGVACRDAALALSHQLAGPGVGLHA